MRYLRADRILLLMQFARFIGREMAAVGEGLAARLHIDSVDLLSKIDCLLMREIAFAAFLGDAMLLKMAAGMNVRACRMMSHPGSG